MMWVVVAFITVAGATTALGDGQDSWGPNCGDNAYWDNCPPEFPPHQNCSLLWTDVQCYHDDDYCCQAACRCIDGYYRDNNYNCVSSHQCYASKPKPPPVTECVEEEPECADHETMAWCVVDCEYKYCPKDDNPPAPCPRPQGNCTSGCVCEFNYKKLSVENPTCILASDCPPVNCTRPNEEWNSCPSPCLREYCIHQEIYPSQGKLPRICHYDGLYSCDPRCICIGDYYRDQFGYCVPAADCKKSTFTDE